MPLSTNYLLGNIKKLPDGSFIVGGKEVSINGVDLSSGEVSPRKFIKILNGKRLYLPLEYYYGFVKSIFHAQIDKRYI